MADAFMASTIHATLVMIIHSLLVRNTITNPYLGLAVISMTINLLQEEVIDIVVNLAKDLGIIDDDKEDDED